ncbi:MAG: hypothetical protein ABI591_10620 [Kofleriaceae bacterium]
MRAQLIEAINKRDAKTVESLVALPLRSEKMRFTGEPCRKFWGVAVLVHSTELPAFVDCIASQRVTAVTAGGDAKVDAIYGPGFPLVIGFDADDKVSALTSASEPGSKPLRIEPSTFASHVAKFSRVITPSATTKRTLDSRGAESVQAELSLCVDETGATVPVATVADPALKPYEQDVADAARSWTVEPFKLDGKPQLACATYIVGSSAAALDQPVQVAIAAGSIESRLLEPLRIRGSKVILPDAPTKTKIAETASRRVIASFKLCLDDKGAPHGITVIKPSGYDAYDQKIMREMANWAYKPYVVAGSAVPVCTAITFVYSME